jgi:diketogulonate reductase-like aldo/keto reductase
LTEKQDDSKYIDAIVHSLESGINFSEISAGYGHGNALRLVAKGLKESSKNREHLFLTNSIYPRDLSSLETAKDDIELFYDSFETDYADSTLVTQSLLVKFGEQEVYDLLHELLDSGRSRFVSLSNASPIAIKTFKSEFGDNFFAHEGHISFEVRAMQDKGIFSTCKKLNIKNIIWMPLRRNLTAKNDWKLLRDLSQKYGKTQNQVILNWICHLGFHPMVMSSNIKHIDENIESVKFEMESIDYKKMTDFRPTNYNPPKVDWEKTGDGVSSVVLVTDFEDHLENHST